MIGSYRKSVSYWRPTTPMALFGSNGFQVEGAPHCLPEVYRVSLRLYVEVSTVGGRVALAAGAVVGAFVGAVV